MDVERAYAPWVDSRKPEFAWLHDRDPPELKGFSFKLSYGVPVGKSFPGDVVFDLSPSGGVFLADSVPNTSSLYVVSERLRALLEKASDRFEFHRVRIRNHKGRIEKAPYFIANLLDIVDCMDKQRSDYVVDPMDPTQAMTVRRLVLNPNKIPDETRIFRLGSDKTLFIVRKDLAFDIYRTHKCEGMLFKKIELYGEEFRTTPPDYST